MEGRALQQLDRDGLTALGSRVDAHLDLLAGLERRETKARYNTLVDKDILAAIIRRNEAKTFFRLEPLDDTRHFFRRARYGLVLVSWCH